MNEELLGLINNLRVAHGKPALILNANLSNVSFQHSHWMMKNSTLDHNSDEPFTSRVSRAGFTGSSCAENIAMGGDAETVVNMWNRSPQHNANMMGDFNLCGIGIAGRYWTLLLVKANDA